MTETQSQKKQAWVTALRILSASPKSRKEIEDKLKSRGYNPDAVTEVLDQLESSGLLSDRTYAKDLIDRYTQSKPSGSRRIRFELQKRGIPEKIREELIAELDPEAEIARARELAHLKLDKVKNLSEEKRRKRVFDFLMRRGFDYQIVREVMSQL